MLALDLLELILYLLFFFFFPPSVKWSALAECLGFILGQNRRSAGSTAFSVVGDRLEICCYLLNPPGEGERKLGLFQCLKRSFCCVWFLGCVGKSWGYQAPKIHLSSETYHRMWQTQDVNGWGEEVAFNCNGVLFGCAVEDVCKPPCVSLPCFRCS